MLAPEEKAIVFKVVMSLKEKNEINVYIECQDLHMCKCIYNCLGHFQKSANPDLHNYSIIFLKTCTGPSPPFYAKHYLTSFLFAWCYRNNSSSLFSVSLVLSLGIYAS